MAGVFMRNRLFNNYCWMGVQDAPYLDIDVFGDDTCYISEALDFEICMNDWWPLFTAEDEL
jgi:hypothetical protein